MNLRIVFMVLTASGLFGCGQDDEERKGQCDFSFNGHLQTLLAEEGNSKDGRWCINQDTIQIECEVVNQQLHGAFIERRGSVVLERTNYYRGNEVGLCSTYFHTGELKKVTYSYWDKRDAPSGYKPYRFEGEMRYLNHILETEHVEDSVEDNYPVRILTQTFITLFSKNDSGHILCETKPVKDNQGAYLCKYSYSEEKIKRFRYYKGRLVN